MPGQEQSLLSRDFILLCLMVLFSNCYLSIYYCFEQWLHHLAVPAGWRGILIGSLFGMVALGRPAVSVALIRFSKIVPMALSILVGSAVLFMYQFLPVDSPALVWMLLIMRVVQGFFLCIYSVCSVSVLVSCIPPGQSARGFALFSLTALIPYAIIPTAGELLLPIAGDEPALYACVSMLVFPCLIMLYFLRHRLSVPEIAAGKGRKGRATTRRVVRDVTHSGLLVVFLAILSMGMATNACIYFMKGLCVQTGTPPGLFFSCYTTAMIFLRVFGNRFLDRLPVYRVVPVVALGMSMGMVLIVLGPSWIFVPATLLYGASLSLLYPLEASMIYRRSTETTRSVNSNLMIGMFDLAALCAPLLGGAILSAGFNYHAVILMGAGAVILSGLLFSLDGLRERARRNSTRNAS